MRYFNKILFLLMAMVVMGSALAQSTHDLRFNEMMIKNVDNYQDEYGRCVPWVEVFNPAYNTVNLAGCYITDDTTGLSNTRKRGGEIPSHWYRISKSDINTAMPQRSFVIFFLDGEPLYGTFHVNFDARTSKTNYLALITSDGKELIDIMHYPASLRDTALVFGYENDGITENAHILDHFTPGSSNEVTIKASKEEKLKKEDPYGIGLSIIAMSVVFSCLILIYLMLKVFGAMSRRAARKEAEKSGKIASVASTVDGKKDDDIVLQTGEEIAAITAALHLHFNSMHDEESEVITIHMPSAHYSPWAQKELVMKKAPRINK